MKHLLLIFATLVLFSCSKDAPLTGNDNAKLVGQWKSISVKDGQTIGKGNVTFLSEDQQGNQETNGGYVNLLSKTDPPGDTGGFYYIFGKGSLTVAGSGAKWLTGSVKSFSNSKLVVELSSGGTTTLTHGTWPPETN